MCARTWTGPGGCHALVSVVGSVSARNVGRRIVGSTDGVQGSHERDRRLRGNWREISVNHAFTTRDAVGADYTFMRSDDEQTRASSSRRTTRDCCIGPTCRTRRRTSGSSLASARFVAPASRAPRSSSRPGIQVDYETTRRTSSAAMARMYRASGVNNDYAAVRGGFLVLRGRVRRAATLADRGSAAHARTSPTGRSHPDAAR